MSKALASAVALLALAATSAQAQIVRANPAVVQPKTTPSLHQPSMIDLQMQIQALGQQVQDLSSQVSGLSSQLAAVNASITEGKQALDHDYRQLLTTEYGTCTLLYLHHWAPNGAHPTASNPYVPDDYCRLGKQSVTPF